MLPAPDDCIGLPGTSSLGLPFPETQKPKTLTVGHSQKMDVILGVGGDGEIKEKEGSTSGLRLDGRSHRITKDLCLKVTTSRVF